MPRHTHASRKAPRSRLSHFCRDAEATVGQSPLFCFCHSSNTTVILRIATLLLTLFSSINFWNVTFLAPTRKKFAARCVRHVILLTDVPGVKTWGSLTMWQTLVPVSLLLCNQLSALLNTNFSISIVALAFSDFWLYAVRSFTIAISVAASRPTACHTVCGACPQLLVIGNRLTLCIETVIVANYHILHGAQRFIAMLTITTPLRTASYRLSINSTPSVEPRGSLPWSQ
jgi:hypothetical protein